nr:uncharacterized protein LOC109777266 [Aegilops tauschii subsp. strangulata]
MALDVTAPCSAPSAALASFSSLIQAPTAPLLPAPAPRRRNVVPPNFTPRRSHRLVRSDRGLDSESKARRVLLRRLGLLSDDEPLSADILAKYSRLFEEPLAAQTVQELADFYGWNVPSSFSLGSATPNTRGLNCPAKRSAVRSFVRAARPAVVCLQETKLADVTPFLVADSLGNEFSSFFHLPADGTRGGIVLAWRPSEISLTNPLIRAHFVTACATTPGSDSYWWITGVYGPRDEAGKASMLADLSDFRAARIGPWIVNGDFNMITSAADKNNDRLNQPSMRRFCHFMADTEIRDLYLHGRRYTWSNERDPPTLTVAAAWHEPARDLDPFRRIFASLKCTARRLQSWSARRIGHVALQLSISRELIARLDAAQDFRPLSLAESWLRHQLKRTYLGLTSLDRSIALQRVHLSWLRAGDTDIAFLPLRAAHRRHRNRIHELRVGDDVVTEPVAMAEAAFSHFSSLLGTADHRDHTIALDEIDDRHFDLSALDQPSSADEIWSAVRQLPRGKAPGPDGFTVEFLIAAWDIVRDDFVEAFGKLYDLNGRGFHKLNEALLTILHKHPEASSLSEYRPISLIHLFAKLFAKVLSLRLAPRLGELISTNQSALIAGRSIHDNFMLVQQTARQLHSLRLPRVLLKLDIARAFDSVSWPFLLEVLQHLGFGPRWRNWISILLSTASTKVLINGLPGPPIRHYKGLRQGDPVSPMLFVIVINVLNRLFQRAHLPGAPTPAHWPPYGLQPLPLRGRRLPPELRGSISDHFPCAIGEFPAKYLGLPLSIQKITASSLQPFVEKLEKKLSPWWASMLSHGERLALIRHVFCAMPTHILIAMSLHPSILRQVNRLLRAFLWQGLKTTNGGHCLVSWAKAIFRASTSWTIGDGATCLFWDDHWINGLSIAELAPLLHALVPRRHRRVRTVAAGLASRAWIHDVQGHLSPAALVQYVLLWTRLQQVTLSASPDVLTWRWTPSAVYSAKSCYKALFVGSTIEPSWRLTWKSWAPLRIKIFLWLAFQGRCWTADRLARRGLAHAPLCLLCDQEPETMAHLLTGCVFSRQTWHEVLSWLRVPNMPLPGPGLCFRDWFAQSVEDAPTALRRGLASLIILTAWRIWKARNACVFNGATPSIPLLVHDIKEDARNWAAAGAKGLSNMLPPA